jgi:cbb3-type cytochrome oxidase maturation protein
MMDIIFVLLPLTLLIAVAALVAFVWSVRRGQFDDMKTPALRVLFDDAETKKQESQERSSTKKLPDL